MTLKIERVSGNSGTQIRISGELRSDQLEQVRIEIEKGSATALDLEEISLVDIESVRFLCAREAEGMLVLHCSPYIREWMRQEQLGKPEDTGPSAEQRSLDSSRAKREQSSDQSSKN